MTNEDIIAKTFWNTIAEILGKEKKNAIESESYGDALCARALNRRYLRRRLPINSAKALNCLLARTTTPVGILNLYIR